MFIRTCLPCTAPLLSIAALGFVVLVEEQPRKAEMERVHAGAREIAKLITQLGDIEHPDFGLSPSLTGRSFAPLTGTEQLEVGLLANHGIKTSQALRQLVHHGPEAIPFLLDALDDQRPTKLTIRRTGFLKFGEAKDRGRYVVKIGDACYVALGQIVGRPYRAISYVPSGMVSIRNVTYDKELCSKIRQEWSAKDPAQRLRASLVADYQKKLVFNGKTLDGWDSDVVVQAAMRLLYYFPKEFGPVIVARLRSLDVADAGDALDRVHSQNVVMLPPE